MYRYDELEFENLFIFFFWLAIITAKGGDYMEQFYCKTKILSGPGSVVRLKELGSQRLLMVADPYFTKDGTAMQIANLSGAGKIEIFDKIMPDPSTQLVAEGTALVQAFKPDTIVALGGGSTLDCAKAMAYFGGLAVRLVAIPTTSGSGSEVTDFAILTHGETKHPLIDEKMQPDVAILDGGLLKQLPKSLIADCGFDVLSHALESYVATNSSAITDALARDGFLLAFTHLSASFGGDVAVRQQIHTAATMAGMAFSQAGLGLCHAMAHALGGQFHLPHGRLNAILMPHILDQNTAASGKYASLARYAGLGGSTDMLAVRNLKNALIRLRRELRLPQDLAQAGIASTQVREKTEKILQDVLADPCCKTNPVPVTGDMVRRVLEAVTGHG